MDKTEWHGVHNNCRKITIDQDYLQVKHSFEVIAVLAIRNSNASGILTHSSTTLCDI